MRTKLGWRAIYPDKHIDQYPLFGPETKIASLGAWYNFRLDQNLPLKFMVGSCGVNLVNGSICLKGKWFLAPPGTSPKKLVYFRRMSASINSDAPTQCIHHVGYECYNHTLELTIPDDGGKVEVLMNEVQVGV